MQRVIILAMLLIAGSAFADAITDQLLNTALKRASQPLRACIDVFDGAQGPAGKTFTCQIQGGLRAITFDEVGLNPSPSASLFPFSVQLYKNGVLKTPSSYEWSTSDTKRIVYGSGTSATFTPSVFGIWSSSKANNYVAVMVNYSGHICKASVPVAVTKVGEKGDKGDPGETGVTNQTEILNFIATPGGAPLARQPLSPQTDTTSMFETRNVSPGDTTWFVSGNGMMSFLDVNGYVRVKINPTTYQLELRDNMNKLRAIIASDGSITAYRGDGSTVAWRDYSTANNRLPQQSGKSGKFLQTNGTFSHWTTIIATGGSGTPGGSNRQIQYNNSGTFAGSAYARYTTGGAVFSTVIIR